METAEDAEKRYTMRPSALVVGIVMTGLMCLLPFSYVLDLGPGPDNIKALVWEYTDDPWVSGFRIVSSGAFLASLLCTPPRFIFLYQMIRYYLSKTTKKPLILTGIASELFPTLVSAALIAGWRLGWTNPLPPLSPGFR